MKRIIALAAAAVLLAGPALAQTVQSTIIISKGVNNGAAGSFIGGFSNSFIDAYQSNSPGIPAGTNADINAFQQTFVTGAASINAANPAPNVQLPFTINFTTGAIPAAK